MLASGALHAAEPDPLVPPPTPKAACGPGSKPEIGRQGRVTSGEVANGRALQGYTCNTEMVSRFGMSPTKISGISGGFRVHRYVDAAGHECAYYDTTNIFPLNAISLRVPPTGVYVLDMSDPAHPVHTATLSTPAMQSPHESLSVNEKRGLLAATLGGANYNVGWVDVYDLTKDCRHPVLKSSMLQALLGHEAGFAPDGNTFYVTSTQGNVVTAIDVSNPVLPRPIWTGEYNFHGISISADGNRLYATELNEDLTKRGIAIVDVSEIQARVRKPTVKIVSRLTWYTVSTPQHPIAVTIGGKPYVIEMDEFAGGGNGDREDPNSLVGAARIIDVADELHPAVISDIRLEVHQPEYRQEQVNDPGGKPFLGLGGYAGHYCSVPRYDDPGILACSFILSGVRVFDIRDPYHPVEIAYFNGPLPKMPQDEEQEGASAWSAPAFAPERNEIWYSDSYTGFYAFRLTNDAWPSDY